MNYNKNKPIDRPMPKKCSECHSIILSSMSLEQHFSKWHPNEQPMSYDLQQNFTPQIDTDSMSEISFNLSEDSIELTQCEISTQTQSASTDISTQTEYETEIQQNTLKLPMNAIDKTSMIARKLKSLYTLPQHIVDIQFNRRKELLIIDSKFNVFSAEELPLFNVYEKQLIDLNDRVTKIQPKFIQKCSMLDYEFDLPKATEYHQLSCQMNQLGVLTKVIAENNLSFEYPELKAIYWDIETFNTTHYNTPIYDDDNSHISMLCSIIGNQVQVWMLNSYSYNQSKVENILAGHIQNNQYSIQIKVCSSDYEIAKCFMLYLKALQSPHYLVGFNATSSRPMSNNEFRPNCYDMNFVIKKACLDSHLFQTVKSDWVNQTEIAYSSYDGLPLIIFLDFKQLCQSTIKIKQEAFESYKLDDILRFFGVDSKISVDMILFAKDHRIQNFDMSRYIAYCIYDCVGLQIVNEKFKLFDELYFVCKEAQMPYSAISKFTNAQKIQCNLLKDSYQQGLSVYFNNMQSDFNIDKKYGALTEKVQPEDQYMYLDKVLSCDFTSQYPNAILQMNISPENISQTPTKFAVDINYLKGDPVMVYFNDKETILSKLVKRLLQLKSEYKSKKMTIQEKAIKLCVNTIYGLQNQNSSPLFNFNSASSVTAFGRKSISYVCDKFKDSGYKILSIDTDGVEVQQISPEAISSQIISQQVTDLYSYMILEIQENAEFIFNSNKKAYLKRLGTKIEMKGFGSKNSLSLYMRSKIQNFCMELLDSKPTNRLMIEESIQNFRDVIRQEISNVINSKGSLDQYCILQKYTKCENSKGVITKSGKLAQRFGDKQQYKIIPYNYNEVRKDYNWAEYSENINLAYIQLESLVDLNIKPIMQFFQIAKNTTDQYKQQLQEGEVMLRVQKGNRNNFINVQISDIPALISDRQTLIYHEKIILDTCKLYFDIETKPNKDGSLYPVNIEKFKLLLNQCLDQSYTIHIANGCYETKQSYHIVVDVIMMKSQMLILAQMINRLYKFNICDTQVYSSADQSLRLPLQCKYDLNGKLTKTMLKIQTNSKLTDFIVQNIEPHHIRLHNTLAYDPQPHFSNINPVKQNSTALNHLLQEYQLDCYIDREFVIIPKTKPYKCPFGKIHQNQNMKIFGDRITCFSDQCSGQHLDLQPETDIVEIPAFKQQRLQDAVIVNQPQITFSTESHKITYIKSQMNTGKTYHLQKELSKYPDSYIIAVSFRITFSIDFARKMKFENYQNVSLSHQIDLNENPRIIIQIDSLHRLCLDGINMSKVIVILDETESIWDQSNAFSKKPQVQNSFRRLIDLLQKSGKIIVLDAVLQDKSVQLINHLARNENYQIIHNVYQPKKSFTCQIIQDNHTNAFKSDYQQSVLDTLKSGKKLVSFCSNKDIARGLVEKCQSFNYSVKIYHGKDSIYEDCHNGKNMITAKIDDFQNLDNLKCDLLIYTSTLTAGVSIEFEWFDKSINYYGFNTCSPIQCIQALQRVRKLSDPNIIMYVSSTEQHSILQTPFKISQNKSTNYERFEIYDLMRELTIYFEARMNHQLSNKNDILFNLLQDQGYTLQSIVKEYTQEQYRSNTPKINFDINLTPEDLELPTKVKQSKFLYNNTDKDMDSKLQLAHLYNLYKNDMTLEKFNESKKSDLHKHKDIQIELNAWRYLAETQQLSEMNINTAIQAIKLRESQIWREGQFLGTIQQSITNKQRDIYEQRLTVLQQFEQIQKLPDDDARSKFISEKAALNKSFVKQINTMITPYWGLTIQASRQRQGKVLVQSYSIKNLREQPK